MITNRSLHNYFEYFQAKKQASLLIYELLPPSTEFVFDRAIKKIFRTYIHIRNIHSVEDQRNICDSEESAKVMRTLRSQGTLIHRV